MICLPMNVLTLTSVFFSPLPTMALFANKILNVVVVVIVVVVDVVVAVSVTQCFDEMS